MGNRINCWEYTRCGRELGGENSIQFGICPVCRSNRLSGINGGIAGGRACWLVRDTLCKDSLGIKFNKCSACSFYKFVKEEEGERFQLVPLYFGSNEIQFE